MFGRTKLEIEIGTRNSKLEFETRIWNSKSKPERETQIRNSKLEFQVSSFYFWFRLRVSISSLDFEFRIRVSNSGFELELRFSVWISVWISGFNFEFQIRVSISNLVLGQFGSDVLSRQFGPVFHFTVTFDSLWNFLQFDRSFDLFWIWILFWFLTFGYPWWPLVIKMWSLESARKNLFPNMVAFRFPGAEK